MRSLARLEGLLQGPMDREAWEELSVTLASQRQEEVGLPASHLWKHVARPFRKGLRACSLWRGEA